ncbi:MAG: D-alanyl-D-alanine carboxypeptidase [Hyphomicrobiaceae bacterium]|nr:D-alanyl-D-alanine carboxypeptidase [Hyphomicrobiaceae bacterium]
MLTLAGARPVHFLLRLALALTLVAGRVGVVVAQTQQNVEIPLKSTQAIVIDADTGSVLFQRNADELTPPASMSKLMLLVLMFMALRSGEITPDTEFLMSEHAWRTGGAPSRTSAMFVPLGKTAKVDELLKGIIVQSANDAAISVAENMRGSEALFAEAMTEEARRLGLKKSVFKNATGLYDPEHLMTVREIGQLARHIIKEFPEYYPLFALREFNYRVHKFRNLNPLLGAVAGVDGIKTGYVKEGGYGIVVSAKQDNHRLIVAINGAPTAEDRKGDARRLLEWGFRNYSEARLFDPGQIVGHARIWGGERMYMPLVGGDQVNVVVPKFPANPKVSARIFYKGPLKPPLKKGEQVATLRVTTANDATSEVPLYAAEDVERAGFVRRGLDSLLYLATRWIP